MQAAISGTNRAELRRRIRRAVHDGLRSHEVGEQIGLTRKDVRRFCRSHGIRLPRGMGANARLISVPLPRSLQHYVDELADQAGVGRSEIMGLIITAVLQDRALREKMKKLARPKRPYRRAAGHP
jgi:hypothetical protein